MGLFEDLQHVNPFEETFRRAVESKHITSNHSQNALDSLSLTGDETLHTPHVMPYFNMSTATCPKKDNHYESIKSVDGLDDELKIRDKCSRQTSEAEMLLYLSKVNRGESPPPVNDEPMVKSISKSPETSNRASVIYVPQVNSIVQPVSGVIYEVAPKKFKPIIPLPQPKLTQIVTIRDVLPADPIVSGTPSRIFQRIRPKVEREVSVKTYSTNKLVKEKLKEALMKLKSNAMAMKSQLSHSGEQENTSELPSRNNHDRLNEEKSGSERLSFITNQW